MMEENMGSHGDSREIRRATAVQSNGAATLLFSRHAILRPRSGRVRARCELVGRSQLWPEEPTFKRKTGRSVFVLPLAEGNAPQLGHRGVATGRPFSPVNGTILSLNNSATRFSMAQNLHVKIVLVGF
jgi:hypothetical protein